ncbi:hypothetical protein O181_001521 [Austropuccinia psidii MF-1]|uniref:Uncharacterized protein n=1 Tax=Austropuccinia psidii MF-1 TaxID=1389203 RepID=A0A9Q3BAE4_9BASI|nr:hypothetical protein [Austropuccinia psidii MF-1]
MSSFRGNTAVVRGGSKVRVRRKAEGPRSGCCSPFTPTVDMGLGKANSCKDSTRFTDRISPPVTGRQAKATHEDDCARRTGPPIFHLTLRRQARNAICEMFGGAHQILSLSAAPLAERRKANSSENSLFSLIWKFSLFIFDNFLQKDLIIK